MNTLVFWSTFLGILVVLCLYATYQYSTVNYLDKTSRGIFSGEIKVPDISNSFRSYLVNVHQYDSETSTLQLAKDGQTSLMVSDTSKKNLILNGRLYSISKVESGESGVYSLKLVNVQPQNSNYLFNTVSNLQSNILPGLYWVLTY